MIGNRTEPWVDDHGNTWEIEKGVTCVVCPHCAFTFDATHEDDTPDRGYTCPACPGQPADAAPDHEALARADRDATSTS